LIQKMRGILPGRDKHRNRRKSQPLLRICQGGKRHNNGQGGKAGRPGSCRGAGARRLGNGRNENKTEPGKSEDRKGKPHQQEKRAVSANSKRQITGV
jgi:hypothetical protein